ncbi:hypothetical protein NMY22_g16813 [Coprinellus aureogranulatus]|nr:hypothetical protein NMY22_g16813 [Coprinellus aureogranulatus]
MATIQTQTNPQRTQPGSQRTILDFFQTTNTPRNASTNRRPSEAQTDERPKLRTKAHVTVASLNIRGSGSTSTINKWQRIASIMRDKHIAILAVQETHLTPDAVRDLNKQFHKSIYIVNSECAFQRNQNSKGVAIVINKKKIFCDIKDIKPTVIEAGRALEVSIPWKNHQAKLNFLAIYAPNNHRESEAFWNKIETHYNNKPSERKPHFVLGDFNFVEDSIDRAPPRRDPQFIVDAFRSLKNSLDLTDGWRREFKDKIFFTWGLNHNPDTHPNEARPLSRIDRIYIRQNMYFSTREWRIHLDHAIKTDHELVSATYYDLTTPYIGNGRWQLPAFLMENEDYMKEVSTLTKTALHKIKIAAAEPDTEHSAQALFQDLKRDILDRGRERAKTMIPRAKKEIQRLTKLCEDILNDNTIPQTERATRAVRDRKRNSRS